MSKKKVLNESLLRKEILRRRYTERFSKPTVTLRDAAKEIGISASTLSRIERSMTPDVHTFILICKWLNKPMEDFAK